MTKHFVEHLFPGIIVSESSTKEIKSRSETIKHPKGAFGFRFYDQEFVTKGGETLKGERKNESGITYIGGEIKTYEDIKREMPDSILEGNMRCNGYKRVVMIRGQAFPLNPEDSIAA